MFWGALFILYHVLEMNYRIFPNPTPLLVYKKVTDSDIDQLIGTYSLRYVHVIEIITINLFYKYWLIDTIAKNVV
jgi:hypothetical protein